MYDDRGRLSYRPALTSQLRKSDGWDEGQTHTFLTVHIPLILTFNIAFLIGLVIWYCCRQNRNAEDRDEMERTETCRTDRIKAEKRKKIKEGRDGEMMKELRGGPSGGG